MKTSPYWNPCTTNIPLTSFWWFQQLSANIFSTRMFRFNMIFSFLGWAIHARRSTFYIVKDWFWWFIRLCCSDFNFHFILQVFNITYLCTYVYGWASLTFHLLGRVSHGENNWYFHRPNIKLDRKSTKLVTPLGTYLLMYWY